MAGVPEIEPTEGTQAQPAPVQVAPPLGSFKNAALGEGLSAIGKEIFATGMDAYHLAVQATSQVAETAYQTRVAKILDDYKNLHAWKAVEAHTGVSDSLLKARQEIFESLPSKLGRNYFDNATLRVLRYAQEGVNAHYERENNNFQFKAYQGKQIKTIDDIRRYPAHAEEGVKQAEKDARNFFESHGADADTVEAQVIKARSAAAGNALKTMAEYGNRDLLGKALEKWGDVVTPHDRGVAEKAYAHSYAAKVVDSLPRIDNDRPPARDDRGYVPYDTVLAAVAAVPQDAPARDVTVDAIWKNYHAANARFEAAGKELENVVDRQGQGLGPGGKWGIPVGSKDWDDFQRLYPARSKLMEGKADRTVRTNLKASIQNARGSALEDFEKMDPDVQKTQTYGQIAASVRTYEVHATGEDIDKVWKRVQQIQNAKGDVISQHMSNIVKRSMRGAFGKDEAVATQYAGVARDYAEDLHASNPKASEEEIIAATTKEAPNWVDGLFSKGSKYRRAPRATPQQAAPGGNVVEWEIGPDGVPRPKGKK